jgi:glutathione synthase/RimK-type ligase-like ATP-grasp enzyme
VRSPGVYKNKGFQEYYKRELGIEQVAGNYYGDINDLLLDENKIAFPFVLKLNEGALSSGVQLIKNEEELINFQATIKKRSIKEKAAFALNKRNSFKKDGNLEPIEALLEQSFEDFFQKRKPIVTQAFVPNLECDYKVLVFGEKYFVLKRKTRENDFRASGSGKFEWVQPPLEVLDYARILFNKMHVPFISFDIGINKNNECYLFEFQGTAFGPLTLVKSDKYYTYNTNKWFKEERTSNLEESYAEAINYHIFN